jgi:L-fuculose-phosphate aldolase
MGTLQSVIEAIQRDDATFGLSGNASERDGDESFWITPSGVPWPEIGPQQLVRLAVTDGRQLGGALRPSTEWRLHRSLYERHPWIGGVVHLHSLYATILSVAQIPVRAVHYQMARVAEEVPIVPYVTFGTEKLASQVAAAISQEQQAVLLANHGLVAVGLSAADAYRACREVEWTAMIQYHAMQVGTLNVLTHAELEAVRQAFKDYGQPSSHSD